MNAAESAWDDLVDWFNGREFSENAILLGFAVVIGLAGAGGVIVFYKLIDLSHEVFFDALRSVLPEAGVLAYRPVITAAGLVTAWWLMRRFARGHDGLNVPDLQLAVVRRQGEVPTGPALVRTAASAVTIGSGGSAGSEGPVVVFGAAIASRLGRLFRFSGSRTSVLVGAGAAAGIAAAFNAPLAGAFFALEEVLGSFSVVAFAPVVVSSVVAAMVSRAVFGNHPVFPVSLEQGYTLTREVAVFYPLLGVACGLISVLFVRTYFGVEEWAKKTRLSGAWLALAGGVVVGAMIHLTRGLLLSTGHLAIPLDLFWQQTWWVLLLVALGKIVATAITLNTGGSGGLFTPSLFVGAATGSAFGVLLTSLFPRLQLSPEPYALVGMGAVIAAATNAPMTGIFMIFEMTNDSAIMVPLMLAVVVSHALARRLERDSLYSGWLRRRGEDLDHGEDREVLAGLRVEDAFDRTPTAIRAEETASGFLLHLGAGTQDVFPVVEDDRRLLGVIGVADLARVSREDRDRLQQLTARDIVRATETVSPSDSLLEAMRRMGARGVGALPVVAKEEGRFLGLLSRSDVLAVYGRILAGVPEGPPAATMQGRG